jgi:hypothetical protein
MGPTGYLAYFYLFIPNFFVPNYQLVISGYIHDSILTITWWAHLAMDFRHLNAGPWPVSFFSFSQLGHTKN